MHQGELLELESASRVPSIATGTIIDPDITLRRTVQYGLKQNPAADKEWHYQRFHQHLMAKYAPGGYLKLWFPEGKNAEQLKKLQAIIADEGQLRQVFNRIFEEEK